MSRHPESTLTFDAGGTPWILDLGKPDQYGDSPCSGNIYLTLDGKLYGSLFIYPNDAGEPIITLG